MPRLMLRWCDRQRPHHRISSHSHWDCHGRRHGSRRRCKAHALLKAYVRENRASFVTLGDRPLPRGHVHATCPGYVYESGGRTWFGFSAALLERVLGGRGGRDALCRQLDRLGLIRKVRAGEDETRYATRVQVGSAREYLLSFDSGAFD